MELQKFLELLSESKVGKYDLLSFEQQEEKIKEGFAAATWKENNQVKTSLRKLLEYIGLSTNTNSVKNNFENSKLWKEIVKHNLESEYKNFLDGEYLKPIICPICEKEGKRKIFSNHQALSTHNNLVHLNTRQTEIQKQKGLVDKHGRDNQFSAWYIDELPVYLKVVENADPKISSEDLRRLVLLGKYTPEHPLPEANITKGFLGKTHSKETKEYLQNFMKNWMSIPENKEKSGFVKWGRKILSPAEKYFYDFFQKTLGIPIPENNKSALRYWMDFAWDNGKFYIEIDGDQHYTKKGIAHDKERTELLKNSGWTLLKRVKWSEYQKKSEEEKKKYLAELIELIRNNIPKEELNSEFKDIEKNGEINVKIKNQ